ncbi:arsenate reductase family protein [Bernardetia sp. OM2101]|uniref:arsenate reductase family protein n=1 Tax=Bernardetia sp. OM2101 TaxID=3344876 RepID=UPI0035D067C0
MEQNETQDEIMESISIKPQELVFIYDKDQKNWEERRTEAKGIAKFVREMELKDLTPTMWKTLLNWLNLEPKVLFDEHHKNYDEKIKDKEYEMKDWLTILVNDYKMIKFPIAAIDKKAVLCKQRNEITALYSNRPANEKMK